jgi:hypothetical protein
MPILRKHHKKIHYSTTLDIKKEKNQTETTVKQRNKYSKDNNITTL